MSITNLNLNIDSIDQLAEAGKTVYTFSANQKIFLFYGDMGAGKTTFIKAICKNLGVTEETSSPTFSIVNEYQSPQGIIYHFDFYRLKAESEAFDFGYEDYFYSGNYCFIEWPEKIPNLLPEHYVKINLTAKDDGQRVLYAEIV